MIRGFARIIALLACVVTLQFAAACTTGDERPAVSSPAPHRGPALWQVSKGDTTIYLFGTIHFLPPETDWFHQKVAAALEAADELVTEYDAAEAGRLPSLMEASAYLPEGENLREKLAREDRKAFEELLVSLGIPVDQFDRYRPWSAALYISVMMTRMAGFDPDSGVEEVVLRQAPQNAARSALETIDYQIEIFSTLPEETQITYLNQVIASSSLLNETLEAMLSRWLDGDTNNLARLVNFKETDPALYKRILTDRNVAWARWIDARLKEPGTVFVAVGAGHLAGRGSVQDQLKRKGIRVRRIH